MAAPEFTCTSTNRSTTRHAAGVLGLVAVFALAAASTVGAAPRRVVILNATDPYLPAFLALERTLREAVHAGYSGEIELYAETLDMHRFPQALLEHDVAAVLRRKYRGLKVDVVVPAARIALDFVRRHRAAIWPDATIVFNSVSPEVLGELELEPSIVGLPAQLDFGPTVELALNLLPRTRRIAVVGGTADPDLQLLPLADKALERHSGKFDVKYIVGLTLAETIAAVRTLPSDAVVLYLTMFRDGAGLPLVPRDALTRIAAGSPVPIFGVFETYVGHGIVAGSIASYGAQGRRTGELVARVLNGDDPAAIGIQAPVAPGCIADWRQLRRWDIRSALVPGNCEVRFREVTIWDHYHWQILGALGVILAQTGLIVALLLNRRSLQRTRSALHDESGMRRQAETIATNFGERLTRFGKERSLGAMATAIAHEVNQPLIAIQNYAQAARRRLEGDLEDKPRLIELFAKIEGQAERAGAITQRVRSLVSTHDTHLAPVPLRQLIEEVVRTMELETGNLGCSITLEPAGDLPAVFADALQVQLVLVNLLRNAMQSVCSSDRYDRGVTVDVRPIDDREVQVSVIDRGGGVPLDRVTAIFDPLASGTGGGMGIGLAISRDIISAHGGRLWHEPNPAGGAIFRFTLRTTGS